ALATAGDGAYAALASADPLATLRLLDPRDGSGGESAGGTASAWQDQGYWLLLPLLLLVAFGFRRGGALALLAACLLLPWQPASAGAPGAGGAAFPQRRLRRGAGGRAGPAGRRRRLQPRQCARATGPLRRGAGGLRSRAAAAARHGRRHRQPRSGAQAHAGA